MKDYVRSFFNRESAGQLSKLALIGVVNTVVYFAFLNTFRTLGVGLLTRTVVSVVLATMVSYFLNRSWTFRIRHGKGLLAESVAFMGVNVVALVVTAGLVLAADAAFGPLTRLEENLTNLAAGGLILLPKLAGYRDLVFRRSIRTASQVDAEPHGSGVAGHLP